MKIKGVSILIFILLLISSLYLYIKSVIDSFDVKFNLDDITLKNISLKALNNKSSYVEVKILFIIKFISFFNISFSDLNLKVYYNNELIANSTKDSANSNEIVLFGNTDNKVYHSFNVKVDANVLDLVYKIKTNLKYTLDYEASFKILGLTINYKNKYDNN